MNVFECLFTTDSVEVIHKISERTACYYTTDLEKRSYVFKLVKFAYGIRSKYFHGQTLDKKHKIETIKDTLKKIDSLIREILVRIIEEDSDKFLKNNEELENWFVELILK